MTDSKPAKVIKYLAIAAMAGCVLLPVGFIGSAAIGYGVPESSQYHDTYFVVPPFWVALIGGIFILSLAVFVFRNSIARCISK